MPGKKLILSLAAAGAFFPVFAQQDAQYSQYMFNKLVYNPAYAGHEQVTSVTLAVRSQWMGFDGNPLTQTLGGHTALPKSLGGAGIYIINDMLGVERLTTFMLSYAYSKTFSFGTLAAGLSLGASQKALDGSKLRAPDGDYQGQLNHNDPNIPDVAVSSITPDLNAGLYFSREEMYAGISFTHLPEPSTKYTVNGATVLMQYVRNYYVLGGYDYALNSRWSLQPSFLVKTDATKTQVDINANAVYNSNLTGGLSWRGIGKDNKDALVALLGMNIMPQLYVGYSYDITVTSIGNYSSGTHEFLLNYKLSGLSKQPPKIIYCPRFL